MYSLIQQMSTEDLLSAKHCARCKDYKTMMVSEAKVVLSTTLEFSDL